MANTLLIGVEEYSNATRFKLSDVTVWTPSFDYTKIEVVTLTVTYNSTDYTLKLWDTSDATDLIGLDGTYVNLFGTAASSYYAVDPSLILDSNGDPLDSVRYPDGYYLIKLDVTHTDDGALTTSNTDGFLAEAYALSAQLPILLDLDDFDYHESRLQRLVLSMLPAAKYAAELGEYNRFNTITTSINSFYTARSLTDLW